MLRRILFGLEKGETDMIGSRGRFVWYELMTTDTGAAKAFYAKVIGWGIKCIPMPGGPIPC